MRRVILVTDYCITQNLGHIFFYIPSDSSEKIMRAKPYRLLIATFLTTLMLLSFSAELIAQEGATKPPIAAKIPHVTEIHGYKLPDDYFWLRDKNNPEVMKYLQAENAYTAAAMEPTKAMQDALYQEMLGHIKQTDLSVPSRIGDYYYYSRTQEGKQYQYMCRKKGSMDSAEELLLDLNKLAEGNTFLGLGTYVVSDDGNLLAYATDTTGYRQYRLHVKDLRTGQTLSENIERVGPVVWSTDNKTLFYTTEDEVSKRSDKVWRHTVGSDKNELLYDEKDVLYTVGIRRSLDKKMIFMGSGSKTTREVRFLPADQPAGTFKIVLPRQDGHDYAVDHYQGQFYITTNKDAKNSRVVTAPISDPSEKNWKPFIAHDPKVKIDRIVFFAGHMVVAEKEGGLEYLRVIDAKTMQSHRISTEEPVYALNLGANPDFNTSTLRFNYQSMVTPPSVYDYDMEKHDRKLLKRQEVLGGYDPKNYEAKRIWSISRDGTKVPVSIVYKKGTKMDGSAPMLLYAYGSYGSSSAPTFSSNRLSLLDRGVVYALAHIRGGGELGEEWREQGRMMKKLNTFYDFNDCADYLIKNKYTSADRLVIQGGSAGGLLMGAVVNMRPDLFKGVVAQVPFVDVMNTMLDASLPLTTEEWIEWGDPHKKAEYDYMIQYSPYDNVKAQKYPAMLVMVSYNDSQVPYWEGTKFTAKLRTMKTDGNPLLLKANLGAGHGGASGRYDALHDTAFIYSFMLWQMGVKQ